MSVTSILGVPSALPLLDSSTLVPKVISLVVATPPIISPGTVNTSSVPHPEPTLLILTAPSLPDLLF